MIIYIAGPITGHLNYRDRFRRARMYLEGKGHIVIDPAQLPSGLEDYMGICREMVKQSDAIYLLEGWQQSKGAVQEHHIAVDNNILIFREDDEDTEYTYFEDRLPEIDKDIYVATGNYCMKAKTWYDEDTGRFMVTGEEGNELEAEKWMYTD